MMLRAVSSIYIESQAFEVFTSGRRDVFKLFRTCTSSAAAAASQTVLTSATSSTKSPHTTPPPPSPPPPPPPLPPSPNRTRGTWALAAAAALTASLGGVYWYRKRTDRDDAGAEAPHEAPRREGGVGGGEGARPVPSEGALLPRHTHFLLVGGGTASFAAMRAIRSARPDARVLIVGDEPALPYMRPPLSKELWREPDLARRARQPDTLTFAQWNGKRRSVTYEPSAFYVPTERLEGGESEEGGASVARGWSVARLDLARREAQLVAPGLEPVTISYERCLLATGSRARRLPALRSLADAGRALPLRSTRDVARLAAALDEPELRTVTVVGGGFLATELSAALAERLAESGKRVVQVFREGAAMAGVLPPYLAVDASRRLEEMGATLLPNTEVVGGEVTGSGRVALRTADGATLETDLVVECVGAEPETRLASEAGLELHPELGGVLVNAELAARGDVFAAGDVACFHDVLLGRRRVEHHDHAVVSGRLAGENMAAQPSRTHPLKHYSHQSMFWSDLGPELGYEAIGLVDSRLPTMGVFAADAVSDAKAEAVRAVGGEAGEGGDARDGGEGVEGAEATRRRYERGVVFYLRERRVVGVLLWNLFNKMHVARQVVAQGEFEDLYEVAKLFSPQEQD